MRVRVEEFLTIFNYVWNWNRNTCRIKNIKMESWYNKQRIVYIFSARDSFYCTVLVYSTWSLFWGKWVGRKLAHKFCFKKFSTGRIHHRMCILQVKKNERGRLCHPTKSTAVTWLTKWFSVKGLEFCYFNFTLFRFVNLSTFNDY